MRVQIFRYSDRPTWLNHLWCKQGFWHDLLATTGGIFCTASWVMRFLTTNSAVKHDHLKNKIEIMQIDG